MNKVKFDKDKAVILREQGMAYEEISQAIGCSLAWVKKTLCGVPKGKNHVPVDATKIYAIAILKKALSELESL